MMLAFDEVFPDEVREPAFALLDYFQNDLPHRIWWTRFLTARMRRRLAAEIVWAMLIQGHWQATSRTIGGEAAATEWDGLHRREAARR